MTSNTKMIINDAVEAKVTIPFANETLSPNLAKKSIDVSITELIDSVAISQSLIMPEEEKTTADWEEVCSQSLDVLGYPNPVNASGLKVLPYDTYSTTYDAALKLKSDTFDLISKLKSKCNNLNSTVNNARIRFNSDPMCQSSTIYTSEYTDFEVMIATLKEIFSTLTEFTNTIELSISENKIS